MTVGRGWSRRDRALAELARARGWVEDGALDAVLAGAPEAGGVGEALLRRGLLTRDQMASLDEAVSGAGSRDTATGADATMIAGTAAGTGGAPPAGALPASIGPYRILRELGRGGMGVVYRALDPQLRREVALKVLLAGADASDQAVERFRREASLLARVGAHPHLVQVHDVGREEGRMYFTMDYIEGTSLRGRLDREGVLEPREAARIAAEVASALEAAHRAGVVHRDVKPHNILLGADGGAFLTDFGLAREAAGGRGLTVTGDVLGTPAYMSPEQAAGQGARPGPGTDVWSLGATLFEMLTGRTPFTGDSPAEILRQVVQEDAPAPGSVRKGLHPDLETICLAALRREPARRTPGAGALEADLRRFLAGEPIQARRMGRLERAARRLSRHKGTAAAGVLAALLAAVAGARAWKGEREADEKALQTDATTQEGAALYQRGREYLEAAEVAGGNGDLHGLVSNLEPALRNLAAAAKLLPGDASVAAWHGRALRTSGLLPEARRELTRATQLNPRQALAWEELGELAVGRLRLARGELKHHVYRVSGFSANPRATMDFGLGFAGGNDADIVAAREEALACYARLASLDVSPARAAYGRGMTALMTDRLPAAIAEFDRAIELDPFMADAFHARAEARDLDPSQPRGGVDDWRRFTELRPLGRDGLQRYVMALLRAGDLGEVPEIVRKLEERFGDDADIVGVTAAMWFGIGRYDEAAESAVRSASGLPPGEKRERALMVALQSLLAKRDFAAARGLTARFAPQLPPLVVQFHEFLVLFEESRLVESQFALRRLLQDGGGVIVDLDYIATIEWRCGNLDIPLALPLTADGLGTSVMSVWIRGLVRMDAGRLEEALADFEEVRARRPDFVTNIVHLAGARFLAGDTQGTVEAMESAIAATAIPEETRRTVQKVVATFRTKLEAAKTPAERGKVLEGLAGSIAFLAATLPETSPARRGARTAANALFFLLQEYYFREGLFTRSIEAGEPLLMAEPWGGHTYKDARARAAAGKKKSALSALQRAIELGFDDGRRLDAERAFDGLRDDPAFRELRARCR
ncbi:MAG: protein kinase [Planctomycetia bacterium]|nr:protein kinase [Planctomycetia bacterium]